MYLSVGRHKRMPRRYRGHDLIWWLAEIGLDRTPVEKRGTDAMLPLITGAYGGHTIDFRAFAQQGITLLGRLQSGRGQILEFADDLNESIAYGDAAYHAFLDVVDTYVERERMSPPTEPSARARIPDPPCIASPMRQLDIRDTGLSSVIWATGYAFDFGWIDLPVLDAMGAPKHEHGVGPVPGVYFLGLPWLSKMNSSFLSGVGDDAARIADHIYQRSAASAATADVMQRGAVPVRTSRIPTRMLVLTAAAMLCFAANSLLCRLALAPRLVDAATFTTLRVVSAAAMLSLMVWLLQASPSQARSGQPVTRSLLFSPTSYSSRSRTCDWMQDRAPSS